jgi:hypothetical protein
MATPLNLESAGSYGQVRDGVIYDAPSSHPGLQGFAQRQANGDRFHKRRVNEAARLYADVSQGRLDPIFMREAMQPRNEVFVAFLMEKYPGLYGDPGGRIMGLRETMSVTDYQALYVDVLDRIYYGYYNTYPVVNKGLVRIHQLRDFRLVSRYLLDGVVSPLTKMDPAAPPPQRALSGPVPQDGATFPTTNTAPIQYQPSLYQAMTSVNWRAFVNDDLGIFQDLAKRLAASGNQGISKFITTQYVDANGPNALLYTTGYGNKIVSANGAASNNPAMSVQGFQDAIKILAGMRDSGGNPILMTGRLRAWYGPSLVATAENLKHMLTSYVQVEGGTSNSFGFPNQLVQTDNWVVQNMDWIMDPYIPIVCTTSGVQHTMWGLTIDPDSQARPNSEVGFLTGFETPQIFTRVPNTQRMGGGVDPMLGDFQSMDSDMKIVTVFGGTQIDGRSTVASTGAGS